MLAARKAYKKLISLLVFVFFFSGFASLIYQVVWQRLLTLYYGVGSISITLIITIYMLGLGAGALLGGFLAERVQKRIMLYFIVELLIGFFGLISLPLLNFLGCYTAGSSYVMSFFYMVLFLCLPTLLMGITLPLLTKIFNSIIRDFFYTVSFLYFVSTIGAAAGTVFASYILISFFGLDIPVYFAAAINFILAAMIFCTRYFSTSSQKIEWVPELRETQGDMPGRVAYLFVFIIGFLAIGYEIIWFRVIGVLVKDSPYAFSSALSVYLSGIALGSFGMCKYLQRRKNIKMTNFFFFLQFFIGVYVMAIFIGYFYLTKYTFLDVFTRESFSFTLHPTFAIPSFLSIKRFCIDLYRLMDVFFWPIIFLFIPTIFMGASFPFISFLALSEPDKEGKTVGMVYFFNIIGNVFGGILTGFVILPLAGTEITLLIFSSVGIFLGLFITGFADKQLPVIRRLGLVLILIAFNIMFFPKRGQIYECIHSSPSMKKFDIYFEEGIDGIIMTYQYKNEMKNYINGLRQGGRPGYHFCYETIEAATFAPKVENVLIIGFGTGMFAETILKMDDVKKITLVELNNTLIKNLKKIAILKKILADKRIDLIIDDGRRFLLRTDEKFDLILIDPVITTTSYSNNIYSRQFFELIRRHLNDRGILMVWMDELRVMPKTVLSVFDQVRLYSFFGLASNAPFERNDKRRTSLLNSFSTQEREFILKQGKYLGDQTYIKTVTGPYPINQDWKPNCEYYLGLTAARKFFER